MPAPHRHPADRDVFPSLAASCAAWLLRGHALWQEDRAARRAEPVTTHLQGAGDGD